MVLAPYSITLLLFLSYRPTRRQFKLSIWSTNKCPVHSVRPLDTVSTQCNIQRVHLSQGYIPTITTTGVAFGHSTTHAQV